jgi:hypothetical protein
VTKHRARGGAWVVALLCAIYVASSVAFLGSPARADDDLALDFPSADYISNSGPILCYRISQNDGGVAPYNCMSDASSNTLSYVGANGSCNSNCNFAYLGYPAKINGHDTQLRGVIVHQIRAHFGMDNNGQYAVDCIEDGNWFTVEGPTNYPAGGNNADTGVITLDTDCDLSGEGAGIRVRNYSGAHSSYGLRSLEIYGAPAPDALDDCFDYIEGLEHGTTFGGWHTFFWRFLVDPTSIEYTFKRANGDAMTTGPAAGGPPNYYGEADDLVIGDAVDNEQAPWLFSITDTARNVECSVSIGDDELGTLIPLLASPVLSGVSGCYSYTGAICPGDYTGATETVVIKYTLGGGRASVTMGPAGIGPCAEDRTPYGPVSLDPGSYASTALQADPDVDSNVWYVVASNAKGVDCAQVDFAYTPGDPDGGAGVPVQTPDPASGPGSETCGLVDVLCGLRNLFAIAAGAVVTVIGDALAALRAIAMTKQPFNYIVRAGDGVSAQLARAVESVTSTDDCEGLALVVPWDAWLPEEWRPTGSLGNVISAGSGFTWTILKCEDFEPIVSTSWYQAIRTAMDPALYLLFGSLQLKRLVPRAVMSG